jgi:hypothetical protein
MERRTNTNTGQTDTTDIIMLEIGVLKCEEPGVELDQTFCNIFLQILQPETRVLSPKKKTFKLEPGPEVLLKTKNQPKHKITNQGCYVANNPYRDVYIIRTLLQKVHKIVEINTHNCPSKNHVKISTGLFKRCGFPPLKSRVHTY